MPIGRGPRLTDNFTVVSNQVLELGLSGLALAVWLSLISKPDSWVIRPKTIQSDFDIGRKKQQQIFSELKAVGLMRAESIRGDGGRVKGSEITVFDRPQPNAQELVTRCDMSPDDQKLGIRSEEHRMTTQRSPGQQSPGGPTRGEMTPLVSTEDLIRTKTKTSTDFLVSGKNQKGESENLKPASPGEAPPTYWDNKTQGILDKLQAKAKAKGANYAG